MLTINKIKDILKNPSILQGNDPNITAELNRISALNEYENELYTAGIHLIAGIDEVGRGPLAGPVIAAAAVLPRNCIIPGIDDSKKLSELKRELLFDFIQEKAIDIAYGRVEAEAIDEINILQATHLAMRTALQNLKKSVDYVLVDGYSVPGLPFLQTSIVKGDQKSISIAAASVMAKVTRDRIMVEYEEIYPQYGFKNNKGYGTAAHTDAILKCGLCPIHRRSFVKNFVR